jgi:predicted nuclease of restriction endonuclease-like (RecB) superfamily
LEVLHYVFMNTENYIQTLKEIKADILRSRYLVARIANKELLYLYYKVGHKISEKAANEKWGSKTIERLSVDLQNEMNGLRGFSATNIKRMRQFYESWSPYFLENIFQNEISPLPTGQMEKSGNVISPSITDQFKDVQNEISSLLSDQLIENFTSISFTSHYEIVVKIKDIKERLFYISKTASEFWTVEVLKHNLKNNIYQKQAKFTNNFNKTLSVKYQEKALKSFRDHYLLDFIRISDTDEDDEKILESEIVHNIKKFMMSLGSDFAFIGNQYRLMVENEEYLIDLLFYNRTLQALVAFELKSGKFKPEYLGKMNFYLSALDEYIKKPNENPSIGIILCKEKNNKIVEFSFRNFNTPMGVATYTTSKKLPAKYKNILPDENMLKKLME